MKVHAIFDFRLFRLRCIVGFEIGLDKKRPKYVSVLVKEKLEISFL